MVGGPAGWPIRAGNYRGRDPPPPVISEYLGVLRQPDRPADGADSGGGAGGGVSQDASLLAALIT